MEENIKLIVEELENAPFNKKYNVSSFTSLNEPALSALFHAVLSEIDPNKYGDECRNDPSFVQSQLHVPRVMELLQVLQYWTGGTTTEHPDMTHEALLIPVKETVWDIMGWLLLRKEKLKERAYLAQFLVKVKVPEEMLMDVRMANCYEQYERQMELFKETHKKLKDMQQKMIQKPVDELKKDTERIDHDIECLSRKVETAKNKFKDYPHHAECLLQASLIRKERKIKMGLRIQINEDKNRLADLENKEEILSFQLNDLIDFNEDRDPETAMNRLEQDSEILKHIVEEKLPRQILLAKRRVMALRVTEYNPPTSTLDLQFLKDRLQESSKQMLKAINDSSTSASPSHAVPMLNYARDQFIKSHEKKMALVQSLQLMRGDYSDTLKLLEERREKLGTACSSFGGGDDDAGRRRVLRPEGFKSYVHSMRTKTSRYKEMRSELQSLQAELGNLSVTKYILEGELKYSEDDLRAIEEQLGITPTTGLQSVQSQLEHISETKSQMDKRKLDGIHSMANMAKNVNSQLTDSGKRWRLILTEVNDARDATIRVKKNFEAARATKEAQVGPLLREIADLEKVRLSERSLDNCCLLKTNF
ncbi:intraflagellar transport protein 81 homolog [Folsomia candida]|uniref:intraflagellar transport protein 81 homolog n=1 Tax=Folsomia candida TaxID=158441 RepID=UPI001604AA84|nr:intraflagellar transport protein 81 homolog [Folsomia candida]